MVLAAPSLFKPTLQFSSDHLTFRYPKSYKQQQVKVKTNDDGSSNLFTAIRRNPLSTISVHKGSTIEQAAAVLKMSQIDILEKNAEQKFKVTYAQYTKDSIERQKIDGYDSMVLTFHYKGNDKKTNVYMKYVSVVTNTAIYYVTTQSTTQQATSDDLRVIVESIQLDS